MVPHPITAPRGKQGVTTMDNLSNIDITGMDKAALGALINRLAAEKAAMPRALSCKVSLKGGVSVYGLNARFPVTLYGAQWRKLIEFIPTLTAFLDANESKLATKDNPVTPVVQ